VPVKIRRMVGAIGVAGVLVVSTVAAAVPAAQATPVSVLQLNICHSGIAGCYAGDAVLAKAVEVIRATRPDMLSVNEACAGDIDPLRAAMGSAVVMFVPAEEPGGGAVTCLNGQAFGNILMVVAALGAGLGIGGRYTAQFAGDEMRVWGCLPTRALIACTTHLTSMDGPTAFSQCRELMARAVGYAASAPVVVSGDTNLHYQGNPNVENCDHTGFYRKGDGDVQQVFATTNLPFVAGRRISMSGTTDHPAWLVTVTLA
jgi:hypothetical protein